MAETETKVTHTPVMAHTHPAEDLYHPECGRCMFLHIGRLETEKADMLEALEVALDSVRAAHLASHNPRQRDMFKLAVAKGEAAIAKAKGGAA